MDKFASSEAVAEEPFDMQELASGTDGGWRRLALSLFVLFGLLVLCAPLMVEPAEEGGPTVNDGQVDFKSFGEVNRPVELLGDWDC